MSGDGVLAELAAIRVGQDRLATEITARLDRIEVIQGGMRADIEQIRADIAQIPADIAQMRGDIAQIRADVDNIRADVDNIRAEVDKLRAWHDRTRGEIMARIDRLSDAISAIRDEIKVNFGAVDSVRRANGHLREEFRDWQEIVAAMQRELMSLNERVTHLEQKS